MTCLLVSVEYRSCLLTILSPYSLFASGPVGAAPIPLTVRGEATLALGPAASEAGSASSKQSLVFALRAFDEQDNTKTVEIERRMGSNAWLPDLVTRGKGAGTDAESLAQAQGVLDSTRAGKTLYSDGAMVAAAQEANRLTISDQLTRQHEYNSQTALDPDPSTAGQVTAAAQVIDSDESSRVVAPVRRGRGRAAKPRVEVSLLPITGNKRS